MFSIFLREKISIKILPHVSYSSFGFKANKYCHFPYSLLPCLVAILEPEGTKNLIPMKIKVMKRSRSQHTMTILTDEGSFDLLSNLSKFVSLSFYYYLSF